MTYHIGSKFRLSNGDMYMIVSVDVRKAIVIRMDGKTAGYRLSEVFDITNPDDIEVYEINETCTYDIRWMEMITDD